MLSPDQFKQALQAHSKAELVPVSVMRELPGNRLRYDVSELAEDIKANGLREPVVIGYNQDTRSAFLTEGNHRLKAAEMAGLTHLPAWVERYKMGSKVGLPVRGATPDESDYVPGTMKPSEIMDWDNA